MASCLTCYRWAKFAANNAVDLISLVLSADPNKRQATSFSHTFRAQGLEQGIPFGSFGMSRENHERHVRKMEEQQSLHEYAQRQELVAKGARMEALDTATDEILKAAKKLEREVRRETRYWQEIVSISDKGWPLQRMRQYGPKLPFAVRYGLPEGMLVRCHPSVCTNLDIASNRFKNRGLAPLRMDRDGSIMLDPNLALKPKTLRVRISENGNITGTSRLSVERDDNMAIEKTIQLARDSLFEEEIYHEMSLESRELLAYGVEYRDSEIHVDISRPSAQHMSRKLLIDLIPRADGMAGDQHQASDWLAKSVAEGLRLLLAHEHNMRLHRRSQLPPPMTKHKREVPPPALLRTVITVFKHLKGVDSLHRYLDTVAKTLQSAGIVVDVEKTREGSWSNLADSLGAFDFGAFSLGPSSKQSISASDQLLEVFLKPFDGLAILSLPSISGTQLEDIVINTPTTIGPPNFGTEHLLSLPRALLADLGLQQQLKFSSVDETTSYLDWILSLHIAHRQLRKDFSPRATVKGNEARLSIRSRGTKKTPTTDYDVAIEIQNGKLKVTALDINSPGLAEGANQSRTWSGNSEEPSVVEFLNNLVG